MSLAQNIPNQTCTKKPKQILTKFAIVAIFILILQKLMEKNQVVYEAMK